MKKKLRLVMGLTLFVASIIMFIIWWLTDFGTHNGKEFTIWCTVAGFFGASLLILFADTSNNYYDY